jgi:hypothetical protein
VSRGPFELFVLLLQSGHIHELTHFVSHRFIQFRQIGRLASLGLTFLLCCFWTIPISFISSLTEVEGLKETWPGLESILAKNPWLQTLLEQIAPLLLLCLNGILPVILREISKFEGLIGSAQLEASLFVKMASFQVRLVCTINRCNPFIVVVSYVCLFFDSSRLFKHSSSLLSLEAFGLRLERLSTIQVLLSIYSQTVCHRSRPILFRFPLYQPSLVCRSSFFEYCP